MFEVALVCVEELEHLEQEVHQAAASVNSTLTPTVKDLLVSTSEWFIKIFMIISLPNIN